MPPQPRTQAVTRAVPREYSGVPNQYSAAAYRSIVLSEYLPIPSRHIVPCTAIAYSRACAAVVRPGGPNAISAAHSTRIAEKERGSEGRGACHAHPSGSAPLTHERGPHAAPDNAVVTEYPAVPSRYSRGSGLTRRVGEVRPARRREGRRRARGRVGVAEVGRRGSQRCTSKYASMS